MADTDVEKKFSINKIYIKDISFEAPNSPAVFATNTNWEPSTKIDIGCASRQLGETTVETVLTITVTTGLEEKTVYLIEVQQAGLFELAGYNKEELAFMLNVYTPNILFPFVREAVSDVVAKGGFPRMMLKPVNFDVLYAQKIEQLRIEDSPSGETSPQ